jgi:hypothetical protein
MDPNLKKKSDDVAIEAKLPSESSLRTGERPALREQALLGVPA